MIYLLKFDSGDTFVGNSYSLLGDEPPSLRSAKQLYSITEKVELEECTPTESNERLKHWIEVLNPSITWKVGEYSNPEIAEVVRLFVNTKLTLREISDITHVNYDTVKKVLQGKNHKEATKGLDLQQIRASRKIMHVVHSIEGEHLYEKANKFEEENNLKPGYLTKIKKTNYEIPLEKFSFRPYDSKEYDFESNEGLNFKMNKKEAFRVLSECGLSKATIQKIFDGKEISGWKIARPVIISKWFPENFG